MTTTLEHPDGTSLELDVTLGIALSPSAVVSSHPVEEGSPISDHVQQQNTAITIEAVITETPFGPEGTPAGDDHLRDVIAFLDRAKGARLQLVDDKAGTFDDVVIVRAPTSFDVVRRMPLTIEFAQIRVATASTVEIPATAPAVGQQGGAPGSADVGEQPTDDPTGAEASGATSALATLADLFGG